MPQRKKMNNTLTNFEKQQYTNLWCAQQGIKSADLGCGYHITEDGKLKPYQNAHPAIDDVIILIKLREEFWSYWNHNEKCVWSGHWSSVYTKRHHLKAKALKNIEKLAITGIFRQQQEQEQRNRIKAIRESK